MTEKTPHILIIDDEQGIRMSMQMFLEDTGFQVSTAASGQAAKDIVQKAKHDLAIVDMRLGDCSGDRLIPELLQLNPDLKILIFTGSLNVVIAPELSQCGVLPSDVVTKPVADLASLEEIIRLKLDKEHDA